MKQEIAGSSFDEVVSYTGKVTFLGSGTDEMIPEYISLTWLNIPGSYLKMITILELL